MNAGAQTNEVIKHYFDMWNADDVGARRKLIEAAWTPDAQSVDPLAAVRGWDELQAFVGGVRERFPAHRVERTGAIDGHHDRLRFPWALSDARGAVVLTGIDCVRLASDGRIAELVGFFDSPPPAI